MNFFNWLPEQILNKYSRPAAVKLWCTPIITMVCPSDVQCHQRIWVSTCDQTLTGSSLNILMKVDMLLEMKPNEWAKHAVNQEITSYWVSLWGTSIKLLPKMQRQFTNIACHNYSPIASIPGVFSQENQTAYIFWSIGKLAVAAITLDLKWPKTP